MLLKEATKKLKAYDQTKIFEILPEKPHNFPKNNLNKSTAKSWIMTISRIPIAATSDNTGTSSLTKLSLFLCFSEIRCSNTLDIEVAINANGMDRSSFDKSKKPVYSDEKNLFIKIAGNR